MAKVKAQPGNPEVPAEMTDKDRIIRAVMTGLAGQNFAIGLLINGEVAVHMAENDYTLKITKKKERVM